MASLRIVFMGTPDFSVPALQALCQHGHDVAAVFTQPDKQQGRGKKVTPPPVKEAAMALHIPVFQPESMRADDAIDLVRMWQPDVIIVIAYGKILPKAILDIPRYGCLYVHGSLLPKYRGAAPIQWAIGNGEEKSGVTIMKLDEGMDTGDMLEKAEVLLDSKETTGTLFDKLSALGAATLIKVLDRLEYYEAHSIQQDESEATYTAKITKAMACIDWTQAAEVIERHIRMLWPHPGAYTLYEGKRLKIWAADIEEGNTAHPGEIIAVDDAAFVIQTGNKALRVTEVQPESRKRMTVAQFLRSCPLTAGTQL